VDDETNSKSTTEYEATATFLESLYIAGVQLPTAKHRPESLRGTNSGLFWSY
jgi:hypothetical protein